MLRRTSPITSPARAKGLSNDGSPCSRFPRVTKRANTIITILGLQLGTLLDRNYRPRNYFFRAGIGRLTVQAIAAREYHFLFTERLHSRYLSVLSFGELLTDVFIPW